jgi:osmoprotectant transport system permease protein
LIRRLLAGAAVVVLLVAALIGWRRLHRPQIVIASKAFPESRLLAEMMAQLIESHTQLRVSRKFGLGGTMLCFNAIDSGEVDIYPEYTGTGLLSILDLPAQQHDDADAVYRRVAEAFRHRYELEWLDRFGFNNNYVLAANPDLGLRTISDLKPLQDTIRARFQPEFLDRADGYPALQERYGLRFRDVSGMEHGLAYAALDRKQIDIMDAYATDGMLGEIDVDLLVDDRHLFPPYDAAPVIRQDTLQDYPQLSDILRQLAGRISQEEMVSLNLETIRGEKSIPSLAADFLIAEGLLSPSQVRHSSWLDGFWDLMRMLGEHLFLTLTATTLAAIVGVGLGLAVARNAERLAGPVLGAVGVLQTVPSLAMLAFMIPIFAVFGAGTGAVPAIAALFLYGLLPIVRNTYTGIVSVPANLRDAGLGMGMTSRQLLWQLELPLATKTIMAGIRTSLVISVGTATLGAFIGAGGFGTPIAAGLQQGSKGTALILWGAVPAALLAITCDFLMARLETRLVPKGL